MKSQVNMTFTLTAQPFRKTFIRMHEKGISRTLTFPHARAKSERIWQAQREIHFH